MKANPEPQHPSAGRAAMRAGELLDQARRFLEDCLPEEGEAAPEDLSLAHAELLSRLRQLAAEVSADIDQPHEPAG